MSALIEPTLEGWKVTLPRGVHPPTGTEIIVILVCVLVFFPAAILWAAWRLSPRHDATVSVDARHLMVRVGAQEQRVPLTRVVLARWEPVMPRSARPPRRGRLASVQVGEVRLRARPGKAVAADRKGTAALKNVYRARLIIELDEGQPLVVVGILLERDGVGISPDQLDAICQGIAESLEHAVELGTEASVPRALRELTGQSR